MNSISIIRFLTNHPLTKNSKTKAVLRYIKWQINTKLNPYPVIIQFTEKAKLIVSRGMTGATGNLYCGLHEFNDMSFLLHFLRKDDLFIDIGANIGSYTILSAAHIEANTIAIEPVPSTFVHLCNNISINSIQNRIKALNLACGSKRGKISFTSNLDTMNHVVPSTENDAISVEVIPLDEILNDNQDPILLKIDVEGFESEVIEGAINTLGKDKLKAIIIELNGLGARYGFNDIEIHNKLVKFGFAPFNYDPFARKLDSLKTFGNSNTIYIKDYDFVNERLQTANKVKIYSSEF